MKVTRNKLLEGIKMLLDSGIVKVYPDIPHDSKIVVTRVVDFDPESNKLWKIEANRSYAREGIECCACHSSVVMSGTAFDSYTKNPDPSRIICHKCLFKI